MKRELSQSRLKLLGYVSQTLLLTSLLLPGENGVARDKPREFLLQLNTLCKKKKKIAPFQQYFKEYVNVMPIMKRY